MNEKIGDILVGTVVRLYPRYAILLFDGGKTGLLHISELSNNYIRNFTALVQVGNIYKVKVIDIDEENGSMRVSVKQLTDAERHRNLPKEHIGEDEVDFSALQAHLSEWINDENQEVNMEGIKLDLGHLVTKIDIASYQEKVNEIHKMIHEGTGLGSDFLGWVDWPENYDQEEFARIQEDAKYVREHFDVLVVCGIGGSYLGARAAIEAIRGLGPAKKPEILYLGQTLDPDYIADTIDYLKTKRFAVNVISKSGTTTETSVAFRLLKDLLEKQLGKEGARKAIYATTDKENGALLTLAKQEGYARYVLPANIGGRFSVLTAVGLFPIAVAGIDIVSMLNGAADARHDFSEPSLEKNAAYRYAVVRHHLYEKEGKTAEFLVTYAPSQVQLGEWWKQLFGESEGKDGKGLLPASVTFTTDLHSMGQFIQDGKKTFFETTIRVNKSRRLLTVGKDEENLDGLNFLAGKDLSEIQQKAFEGTIEAHTVTGKNDNLILEVEEMDGYHLGYLFYFFMKACAMSAYLNGVNPFNQPGVEVYKKNMFHLLGKPGY